MKRQSNLDRIVAYRPLIFGIAQQYLPRREDREDLVQEVLLKLWRHEETRRGDLEAWISVVTHNTARDELRRKKHRPSLTTVAEDFDFIEESLVISEHLEPPNQCFTNEVWKALDCLEPESRQVLWHWAHGATHEQIARLTGKALGTVKSCIHYAKKKIRARLILCLDD